MKKLILLIIISTIVLSVNAQEKIKQQELGLVFQNLDNFGVMYKFGHQKSMWRLKAIYGSATSYTQKSENDEHSRKTHQFGIGFGKQYPVSIDDKLDFIYGMDVTGSYGKNSTEQFNSESELMISREDKRYTAGLNLVLGFNYVLKDKLVFGVELLPGVIYSSNTTTDKNENNPSQDSEWEDSGFNIGISSSSALLSVAYRF